MSENATTKSVLDRMKADAARRGVSLEPPDGGYAKAAPEPVRVPLKPLSGSVNDLITEQQAHERKASYLGRMSVAAMAELRERIAAAPAKLERIKASGDTAKLKAAEAKLAELQEEYKKAICAEAKWYMLDVASRIAIDFKTTGLTEAAPDGATLTFDVPGLLTFKLDLTSYEDIPF